MIWRRRRRGSRRSVRRRRRIAAPRELDRAWAAIAPGDHPDRNPSSASAAPTGPVEVQPSPWRMARPPRNGPSALAVLKAEWFSAAASACASPATLHQPRLQDGAERRRWRRSRTRRRQAAKGLPAASGNTSECDRGEQQDDARPSASRRGRRSAARTDCPSVRRCRTRPAKNGMTAGADPGDRDQRRREIGVNGEHAAEADGADRQRDPDTAASQARRARAADRSCRPGSRRREQGAQQNRRAAPAPRRGQNSRASRPPARSDWPRARR